MNQAQKIRFLRKKQGLTLQELADKSGSAKSYIFSLENDPKLKPSAQKLQSIADTLGTVVSYFLDDNRKNQSLDELEEAFLFKFRKLSASNKNKILKMIEIIS